MSIFSMPTRTELASVLVATSRTARGAAGAGAAATTGAGAAATRGVTVSSQSPSTQSNTPSTAARLAPASRRNW